MTAASQTQRTTPLRLAPSSSTPRAQKKKVGLPATPVSRSLVIVQSIHHGFSTSATLNPHDMLRMVLLR